MKFWRTLLLMLGALGGVALLWSQLALAILQGVVKNTSGATLAQTEVVARNVATGHQYKTLTDAQGRYKFSNLPPGDYSVTAAGTTVTGVWLQAGQTLEQALFPGAQSASRGKAIHTRKNPVPPPPPPPAAARAYEMSSGVVIGGIGGGIVGGIGGGIGAGLPAAAPLAEADTEDYGIINEVGFAEARRKPLSTFSIDVDTAAYAIVRRHLREGRMPPADAVRVEELLNYFRYNYPNPQGTHPFSVTTEMTACPWNAERRIVHIGLKSRDIAAENLPPANLTFLVDVSGSMGTPNKLPLLKKSFALLVDQLRPQDRVAIAVYAGAAGLVLEPTSGAEKEKIRQALDRLEAGGSTAGAAGIRLAYETARKNFFPGGNNRVILATDGDFNVGASSDGELIRIIETERGHGVFLTVLGYGMGNTKDAKMEALSRHGNGNYAYIDNMLEARRVLVEQMGATLLTVAKDVKLQVEFNPAHVKAYRLIGYENRRLRDEDFKDDKKDAGDMGAGHSVTALYEVIPAGSTEEVPGVDPLKYQRMEAATHSSEALTVKLRYKKPDGTTSVEFAQTLAAALSAPSEDLRFAMAVTEFGLLLRESKHQGKASFDQVVTLAEASLGRDYDGRRAEFLALVKQARGWRKN